jgi:putative ABC transport system ATP-binding protein
MLRVSTPAALFSFRYAGGSALICTSLAQECAEMTDVLRVSALRKSFRSPDGSTLEIINIPEFSMREGEQLALHGPSGTGKTTFLHLVAGILGADAGSIIVDGVEIAQLSESARDRLRAQKLGYIFQTFNLLQGFTALENVMLGMMFGSGASATIAKRMLERVGLSDRMNYLPRQLSVGQQQRVAVARALAGHPRLVLADEPTGNLDFKHASEALELIREVCRESGAALLLVSHDQEILGRFENRQELGELNRAAMIAEPAK